MDAVVHTTLASFDAAAHDRLAADPVRNTIALTSLHGVRSLPDPEQMPTLITFHDQGRTVGSLIRTPPWPVQAADMPLEAAELAASVLRKVDPDATAVTGPQERSVAFATAHGDPFRRTLATRQYLLDTLAPPAVDGAGRLATEADIDLLGAWYDAFARVAVPEAPPGPPGAEIIRNSLQIGNGHAIWETNGTPVAWAAASLPHTAMTRVGPVYTPPEHRRHGYGAAASAMASQWALAQGATTVLLFADLTNPVSNSIYQRIGYRPLGDWAEYSWKR